MGRSAICCWLAPAILLACGSERGQETGQLVESAAGGSAPTSSAGGMTTGIGGFGPGGSGGGGPTPSILYVHSNTTLYSGDPADPMLSLTQLGDFDCIGGSGQDTAMTDVAVDRAGEVWAISQSRVYRLEINGSTVHCTDTINLNNPSSIRFYGLSFAPIGVLSATAEVLVAGNSAGELWQIDTNGNLAQKGTFGVVPSDDGNGNSYAYAGENWELSGDIVFFENGGSPIGFATVRDCPNPPSTQGCNNTDTLIELDVPMLSSATTQSVTKGVRGLMVRSMGCNDSAQSYGRAYGIAGYEGQVLGFSRSFGDGFALTIENVDGQSCAVQTFSGIEWAGAGITTLAPVVPPPPA